MCPLNANQSSCRPPVEIFISELSLLKLILSRLENILGPQSNESHLCRHVTLYAILAFALSLLLLKTERISGCRDVTEKLLVIVQALNSDTEYMCKTSIGNTLSLNVGLWSMDSKVGRWNMRHRNARNRGYETVQIVIGF